MITFVNHLGSVFFYSLQSSAITHTHGTLAQTQAVDGQDGFIAGSSSENVVE